VVGLGADLAAVRIDGARRPETGVHVSLEAFDGPLALLLSLIEARRLDVLTVPLGALADGYLEAIAMVEVDRLGHLSSFVAVASQLILIKSRALLPRQEVPAAATGGLDEPGDPEAELRARLLLYRAHRDAGARLADEANLRGALFRREPSATRSVAHGAALVAPAPPLDPKVLALALVELVRIVPPSPPPPEVVPPVITLAERASLIRQALREAGPVVLQDLLAGVRDRLVVAVTFLAMLELVKRREVAIEQAQPWGPILVRPTTVEERGGLTAEVLAAIPIDESMESFG
jgi:segregation and condensation protein A